MLFRSNAKHKEAEEQEEADPLEAQAEALLAEATSTKAEEPVAPPEPPRKPGPDEIAVDITLRISDTKVGGKGWDVGGNLPDIGLCVDDGDRRTCLPGNGSSVPSGKPALCQDALSCSAHLIIPRSAKNLVLEVVDVEDRKSTRLNSSH